MNTNGPSTNDAINWLCALGYATSRQEAARIVADSPEACRILTRLYHGPEMRHPDDRAAASDWGPADTGQGDQP